MNIKSFILFGAIIVIVVSCNLSTSTKEEFLTKNFVSNKIYSLDKSYLEKIAALYLDSVNSRKKPVSKSQIISISIDTIFYGDNNKMAFLYISEVKNPYVTLNEDSLQFIGGCFIAIRKGKEIKIKKKLKYSVTKSEIPNDVSRSLRITYLREMEYIDGRYNINDNRFWNSDVWRTTSLTIPIMKD